MRRDSVRTPPASWLLEGEPPSCFVFFSQDGRRGFHTPPPCLLLSVCAVCVRMCAARNFSARRMSFFLSFFLSLLFLSIFLLRATDERGQSSVDRGDKREEPRAPFLSLFFFPSTIPHPLRTGRSFWKPRLFPFFFPSLDLCVCVCTIRLWRLWRRRRRRRQRGVDSGEIKRRRGKKDETSDAVDGGRRVSSTREHQRAPSVLRSSFRFSDFSLSLSVFL